VGRSLHALLPPVGVDHFLVVHRKPLVRVHRSAEQPWVGLGSTRRPTVMLWYYWSILAQIKAPGFGVRFPKRPNK
jgi:hypothetical protein